MAALDLPLVANWETILVEGKAKRQLTNRSEPGERALAIFSSL